MRRTPTAISTSTSRSRTCSRWATRSRAGLAGGRWWTGGWIGGIVGGLQRLQTLANDGYDGSCPARGPVLSLADIKAQTEMYGTIYDRLTQTAEQGARPGEAVDAKPTKEFEAKMGNPDEFVRRAFESLWAYLSPDA